MNPFYQRVLFVKYGFDLVVLEKKILNAVKCIFTIMPLYLLNNMSGLSFENKIQLYLPKDALCQVWLKLAHLF